MTITVRNGYRSVAGYIKGLREQGMSYDHIAKRLNNEGHRTRQGGKFYAATVHRILQRNDG